MDVKLILIEGATYVDIDSSGVALTGNDISQQFSKDVLSAERTRRIQQFALNDRWNAIQTQRGLTADEHLQRQREQDAIGHTFMRDYGRYLRENIQQPFASELLLRYPLDRYTEADSAYLVSHCDRQLLAQHQEREAARKRKLQYFQQSQQATKTGNRYREIVAHTPTDSPSD